MGEHNMRSGAVMLRLWLEYLLQNPPCAEDFAADMEARYKLLLSQQNGAILADDMTKAKLVAHEARVYEGLYNMIKKEMRERKAQLDYADRTAAHAKPQAPAFKN